ncbi:MAG TPA: hypothetical protein VMP68_19330 [Candidatus Eisenbacteria bacterium]|nr:hypothetical protein [Candidatus Eisenbacteria bacterium]
MEAQTYPGSHPHKEISNGVLRTKVYLPDAENGFYRGTRFDWAGTIGSLEYSGHQYFGPFFEKFNPAVPDVEIGNPIEAGINSAASGPVEEFTSGPDGTALGYNEAKPGDAFCKIGIGSLRKLDNVPYSSYTNYPILNGGQRTESSGPDWIEFTQDLTCGSGYGYTYTKTIRLAKNEPVMTIEHRLMNTGKNAIETQVYDHNFLTIDRQTTGPATSIVFAFAPQPTAALDKLAEVRGKQLLFPKDFKGSDTFYAEFTGFGNSAKDYEITVENQKSGAGVVIQGDQPLVHIGVWAVRTVVAPEPYIRIKVPVGREFRWMYTYRFYTSPQ